MLSIIECVIMCFQYTDSVYNTKLNDTYKYNVQSLAGPDHVFLTLCYLTVLQDDIFTQIIKTHIFAKF